MRINLANDLTFQIDAGSDNPLVFEPDVDWRSFDEPNIIHAY